MPQLMPAGQDTPGTRLYNKLQPERDRKAALEESGRDPFAEGLQRMVPINRATEVGREQGPLAGVADFMRGGTVMRGGVGAGENTVPMQLFRTIARRLGVKPQDVEDMANTAAVRNIEKNVPPGAAGVAARRDMIQEMQKANPMGIRQALARHITQAEDTVSQRMGRSVGPEDDFKMLGELRKRYPDMTLEDMRHMRLALNPSGRPISMEETAGRTGDRTVGETLAANGEPTPDKWAAMRDAHDRLTPAQQGNMDKLIQGADVNPAIKARILAKLQGESGSNYKPISGGSSDQITNPDQPAFGFHSLYNVKQQLGPNSPPVSPRDLLEIGQDMKLGPGTEPFYGQGQALKELPPQIIQGPKGSSAGMASPDTNVPGPTPPQGFGEFRQLQRMIMDALLNTGRN